MEELYLLSSHQTGSEAPDLPLPWIGRLSVRDTLLVLLGKYPTAAA